MEKNISFELVSPEQLIFSDNVGMIIIPGKEGDIGILPGHSKLLSSLRPGRLLIYDTTKNFIKSYFVSAGFVEVNPEKCIVLSEEVEEISNLDQSTIEQQLRNLENENSKESQEKYLIAKSKIEALNSTFYEKV